MGDDPCPGVRSTEYHTQGRDDLKSCALVLRTFGSAVNVADLAVMCVRNCFAVFADSANIQSCPGGRVYLYVVLAPGCIGSR